MNAKDAILKMPRRADKWEDDLLVNTFVNIGPLIPLLRGVNNQILFGRRGTGKTHILRYLKSIIENEENDCCIFIDIRQIGSTGSIYLDNNIPSEQRAVRLFTDVLQEIRNQIIEYITSNDENKEKYLSTVTPLLDGLLLLLDIQKVSGSTRIERQVQEGYEKTNENTICISHVPSFTHTSASRDASIVYEGTIRDGQCIEYIDFLSVHKNLQMILDEIQPHRIWILIDEFAELSTELQIALADMFRRVLCPLRNCVFKIAAIEHRSNFKCQIDARNYKGLELGADVYSCNLDDFLVFSNNRAQALSFFRELIFQHVNYMLETNDRFADSNSLIEELFTRETVFEELVMAAEGVPRDAFNILA